MNQHSITETTARNLNHKLKLRLAVAVDKRLEYINSILTVLNESRSGTMHSDKFLGSNAPFSEAEAEVGSSETDAFFQPSWTAYSDYIPTSRCASFCERDGCFGTLNFSSFATSAFLRENSFSNATTAKYAKKNRSSDLSSVFGTYLSDCYRSARLTTRPPPRDQ